MKWAQNDIVISLSRLPGRGSQADTKRHMLRSSSAQIRGSTPVTLHPHFKPIGRVCRFRGGCITFVYERLA